MFLLVLITVLCSFVSFANLIAKPIQSFLKRPSADELQIQREVDNIKKELATISVRDQYTEYVKTERKIVALEKALSSIRSKKFANNLLVDYGVKYGIKGCISLLLLIISILYRSEPVVVFDKKFNFAPFGSIMNFPTGIDGAVSAPFWIFIQSFLKRPSADELQIQREVDNIKKELATISVRDQYTEYVKTERKIVALEKALSSIRSKKFANNLLVDYGVKYGIKGCISLLLLIISILYRSEPVVVFDKKFNFAPFGSIMNFPTGIDGAVSAPFWIFIQSFLKRPSADELQIQREVDNIKKELATISVRDQYTEYVKTERKIVALEKALSSIRSKKFANNLLVDYGVKYGIKGCISLLLLIISILYRSEPVVVFDKKFNFAPFGSIMNFPTGIDGAVSAPFWIFVSSFTLRSITDYLKI